MKKNYFLEDEVKPHFYRWLEEKDEEEKQKIFTAHLYDPINKVILGTINTNKGHKFIGYEEAYSTSWYNVLQSLDKFDESKGKEGRQLFNYISLVVKRSCYFAQIRNIDKIQTTDIDKYHHLESLSSHTDDVVFSQEFDLFLDYLKLYIPLYSNTNSAHLLKSYSLIIDRLRELGYSIVSTHSKRMLFPLLRGVVEGLSSYQLNKSISRVLSTLEQAYDDYVNNKLTPGERHRVLIYLLDDHEILRSYSACEKMFGLEKNKIEKLPIREHSEINGVRVFRYY